MPRTNTRLHSVDTRDNTGRFDPPLLNIITPKNEVAGKWCADVSLRRRPEGGQGPSSSQPSIPAISKPPTPKRVATGKE